MRISRKKFRAFLLLRYLYLGLGGGGGYSHVLATGMCRWRGYGFQAIWSGIGSSNHRKLV